MTRVLLACTGKPLDDKHILPEISILFMAGFESAPLPMSAEQHRTSELQLLRLLLLHRLLCCHTNNADVPGPKLRGEWLPACSNRPHGGVVCVLHDAAPGRRGKAGC